jgi:hypothetical protein
MGKLSCLCACLWEVQRAAAHLLAPNQVLKDALRAPLGSDFIREEVFRGRPSQLSTLLHTQVLGAQLHALGCNTEQVVDRTCSAVT